MDQNQKTEKHKLAPKCVTKILKNPNYCCVKMEPQKVVLFLTLEVVLKLIIERLKRGTKINFPAYIYIYIFVHITLPIPSMPLCLSRFLFLKSYLLHIPTLSLPLLYPSLSLSLYIPRSPCCSTEWCGVNDLFPIPSPQTHKNRCLFGAFLRWMWNLQLPPHLLGGTPIDYCDQTPQQDANLTPHQKWSTFWVPNSPPAKAPSPTLGVEGSQCHMQKK